MSRVMGMAWSEEALCTGLGLGPAKSRTPHPTGADAEARVWAQVAHGRDPLRWGQILAAVRSVSWSPNIFLASGTYALPTREGGLVPAGV